MQPHSDQPYCADHRLQPDPGQPLAGDLPEVRRHQRLGAVTVEQALLHGVAELEGGVVVAGVLVVDQPDPLSVVDEVGGQQVVVAGHHALGVHCQRLPDPLEGRVVVAVAVRQREPVVAHRRQVAGLALEHVEVAPEPRARVQPADRHRRPPQHVGAREVLVPERDPLQPADHQHPEVRPVVDDRGTYPGLLGHPRVVVLGVAVDAERVGVTVAAPCDVHPLRRGDLDDPVGQPAGDVLDGEPP